MANSNNICTRFINYVAVLILAFLSSQSFAAGGSFGGGGAGGSWGDESKGCKVINGVPLDGAFQGILSQRYGSGSAACNDIESRSKQHYQDPRLWTFEKDFTGQFPIYQCAIGNVIGGAIIDCSESVQCEDGYEKNDNGQCVPKKCPVGETLVNGQCQKKQCPAGQALDLNGNCMPRDDQCPAGQIMVNGRCTQDPNAGDEPPPPAEWPPFCEWASVMCQWHQEWQQWSNDYAANEEKANLDREELKRLGLDSKEQLIEK